jgi:hypothetical protein
MHKNISLKPLPKTEKQLFKELEKRLKQLSIENNLFFPNLPYIALKSPP